MRSIFERPRRGVFCTRSIVTEQQAQGKEMVERHGAARRVVDVTAGAGAAPRG